jgi:hypothetical protein
MDLRRDIDEPLNLATLYHAPRERRIAAFLTGIEQVRVFDAACMLRSPEPSGP